MIMNIELNALNKDVYINEDILKNNYFDDNKK